MDAHSTVSQQLEKAWEWRQIRKILDLAAPTRIFHGPGEGKGALSRVMIDRFPPHFAWVVAFDEEPGERLVGLIEGFLRSKGFLGGAIIVRKKGQTQTPPSRRMFGDVPDGKFVVQERSLRFRTQLIGVRQPGLFLDHRPLREWLIAHEENGEVLNLFSFTGALSVAAGLQASRVVSVDLSKPSNQWAQENWLENGLPSDRAVFVQDDAMKWMAKETKRGRKYGTVILDPPTFARVGKRVFSTEKNLVDLHRLALPLVAKSGCLVTAINSASVPRQKFKKAVLTALQEEGREGRVLHTIELPKTFPEEGEGYLKGFCLEVI